MVRVRPSRIPTAAEARAYLESLPELWAETSDAGRHAIAEAVFERIDVSHPTVKHLLASARSKRRAETTAQLVWILGRGCPSRMALLPSTSSGRSASRLFAAGLLGSARGRNPSAASDGWDIEPPFEHGSRTELCP